MDPAQVRTLAANTLRLRQQAEAVCKDSAIALRLSQEMRAKTRQRIREHVEERVRRAQSLREQFISRRLLTGLLPRSSVVVIIGGPGAAGSCDGCDKPLTSARLVTIPSGEQEFVRLHAECFMIWNAIRPHNGERNIA